MVLRRAFTALFLLQLAVTQLLGQASN
jgi:hypothetical protein